MLQGSTRGTSLDIAMKKHAHLLEACLACTLGIVAVSGQTANLFGKVWTGDVSIC
jgi:hypothetical protein